jgi:hypothetical protein
MGKMRKSRILSASLICGFCASLICGYANARAETTIVRPDGTIETTKTIEYYPPTNEYIVFGIAIVVGGLITLMGAKLILRGIELGHDSVYANADIDVDQKTIKVRKISQGAVISLIGASIVLGSLYLMTS